MSMHKHTTFIVSFFFSHSLSLPFPNSGGTEHEPAAPPHASHISTLSAFNDFYLLFSAFSSPASLLPPIFFSFFVFGMVAASPSAGSFRVSRLA